MKYSIAASLASMVILVAADSSAQDPGVRDLTGHVPSEQEYIDGLKPKDPAAVKAMRQTRGIGVSQPTKPQCKFAAEGGNTTRGIAPVSDAVAVKVEFASGSATLTSDATKTLDSLGRALNSDDLKSYCFVIEGHTDSVGSAEYNKQLSERRAKSVIRYLSEQFQVEDGRLQAVGHGKDKPIADNGTDEGRQKNRRVQIANIGG